jgi:octaprenyl-diphosphate synthase
LVLPPILAPNTLATRAFIGHFVGFSLGFSIGLAKVCFLVYFLLEKPRTALHEQSKNGARLQLCTMNQTNEMNLTRFLAPDFERLNQCIQTALHSDVALVQQVATYIVHAGGKRMRPALLMLASDVVGLRGDKRTTTLAAVVEFIHTATLLHDDVVDESGQRRGQQTANALFGNAASVLVGDFLYSRAFQMMVECGNAKVMQVLADATNVIAEGEVLQLMHIGDTSLSEAQYLKVIEYKTAKLFEAAARLPAVIAGDDVAELALASYGRKVGAAFQIIDDVLDYEGDAALLGKNLGDDLREGKVTLPLIYAMQRGSETQKRLIETTIAAMQSDESNESNEANEANETNLGFAHKPLLDIASQSRALTEIVHTVQSLGANQAAKLAAKQLALEAVQELVRLTQASQSSLNALHALANQAVLRAS